ncbi:hypothetical protein [uncultured Varibaculum sp.]|uniref:hypothetical protein n=1 Tax=uncultured Varibaculum sp. TaxID=413896 RepID=UPI00258EEEBE|nr:hypothetical protein [uncultured Varibaculum sp.]
MHGFLVVLWTLGILAAIICPIVMFVWLFRKANATLNVFGEQVQQVTSPLENLQEASELPALRPAGASGDPQVLAAARQVRAAGGRPPPAKGPASHSAYSPLRALISR